MGDREDGSVQAAADEMQEMVDVDNFNAQANVNEAVDDVVDETNKSSAESAAAKLALALLFLYKLIE